MLLLFFLSDHEQKLFLIFSFLTLSRLMDLLDREIIFDLGDSERMMRQRLSALPGKRMLLGSKVIDTITAIEA